MIRRNIRLAFDALLREKNSAANTLLEGIALIVIGVMIFIQSLTYYNYNESDKILKYGVENSGKIDIELSDEETDYDALVKEIKNIKGIKAIGYITEGSCDVEGYKGDFAKDIYELQKNNEDIMYEKTFGKYIETVILNYGSEGVINIDVDKGYNFNECDELLEEYEEIIYLGSNLSGYDVGEVIYNERGGKCIIGGYLKSNQRILIDVITGETLSYIDVDDRPIILKKLNTLNIFAVNSSEDMEGIREKIKILEEKYDASITMKTYDGIFDGILKRNKTIIDFFEHIATLVILTVIILQICMQTVNLIENFRNYGILYANGFSTKDHMFIFVVQNAIKGIVGMILAIGAGYILIDLFYTDVVYSLDILYEVFWKYTVWKMGICAMLITIITSLITIFMFKKKSPKELIQEN
ncbi:MAG: ABC transporter permease [Lachnospiraceae bacterium]|nr:ABC transporter permease [Lachnospiraceae bacterium]